MGTSSFWEHVTTSQLAQGDFLPDCRVPIFFGSGAETEEIPMLEYDLVIVTQSSDLENHARGGFSEIDLRMPETKNKRRKAAIKCGTLVYPSLSKNSKLKLLNGDATLYAKPSAPATQPGSRKSE